MILNFLKNIIKTISENKIASDAYFKNYYIRCMILISNQRKFKARFKKKQPFDFIIYSYISYSHP